MGKKINHFYRGIKLKTRFKHTANHQHLIEDEIFKKPSGKSWFPIRKQKPLEELKLRNDIVITNADKGGAVARELCKRMLKAV